MPTKVCKICNEELSIEEFWKDSKKKDGLCYYCKSCGSKMYEKTGHIPSKRFNKRLQKQFGISLEEYNALLIKQNDGCAICGSKEISTFNGKVKAMSVDHNHKTGEVRGILCHKCNTALGLFAESPQLLERAISYLKGELLA